METKQTAESTKTDAQFKIDYNSGKYYEAVSNKLFEIRKQKFEEFHKKGVEKAKKHTNIFKQLHDLLGDDALYYNQVVNLVALRHAFNEPENFDLTSCLAEMICKLDSFIRDIIETGSEKESVKQDTEILKGTKTSEDLDNLLVDIDKHKQYGLPIHLPDKLRKRLKIHSTF